MGDRIVCDGGLRMCKIINLCGRDHPVKVCIGNKEWIKLGSEEEARVIAKRKRMGFIVDDDTGDSIPTVVYKKKRALLFPSYRPFPEKQEGVVYITSAIVRDFLRERDDIFSPDRNNMIKEKDGNVIMVKFLRRDDNDN